MLASLTVTFAGCASYYKVGDIESRKKDSPDTFRVWRPALWRKMEVLNPKTYKLNTSDPTALYTLATGYISQPPLENAIDTNSPALLRAKIARNELQEIMIGLSDREVARHLSEVTGTQITVNMVLGAAALGTSGAGALATTSMAKVFSGMASGFTGAKSLFNEEVYRNALVQTIVSSVISKRNEIRTEIQASQDKSILEYSMDHAINDVRRLNETGSFYYGITLIKEAAEATNAVRNATVTEPARQALRAKAEAARTKAAQAESERIDAEMATQRKALELKHLQEIH
jgi:hypothetical protein